MKANYEPQRKSWRQPAAHRHAAQAGSLRGKRIFSTVVLLALVLAGVWLIWSVARSRYQHTLVAAISTASRTNTSEPEQPYTLAPLRFGSETLQPLSSESTEEFHVESLNASFDNAENLGQAIRAQISELERDDALVLWIRAKGVSLGGTAYLLSGDYRLPASAAELSAPRGAVPFQSILEVVGEWSGPSLILLDWGNQLADARAGMWDNQFLPLAVADMATAAPQVHCLVSHLSGEVSLESLASQQSLFGHACAEAIAGPRRTPADYQPIASSRESLWVGDVAEYVIRRVQADSRGLQTPWLLQGGVGWASAERVAWADATSIPIVQLADNGRPLRWPDVAVAESQESDSAAANSVGNPPAPTAGEPNSLTTEQWATGPAWLALQKWQQSLDKMPGWSLAALAPLTAHRLATQLADLEARWLAGEDFRSGSAANDLIARIEALHREIEIETERITSAAASGPFSVAFAPPPPNVPISQFEDWQQWVGTHAAFRQLAICLTASATLADNLTKISKVEVSNDLGPDIQRAIRAARDFLDAKDGETGLSLVDPRALAAQLRAARDAIDGTIHALVTQVLREPARQQPLAEALLRYYWLSYAQRRDLLQAYLMQPALSERLPGDGWPTKDLSLLQPPTPIARQGALTLWSDVARLESAVPVPVEQTSSAEALVNLISQAALALPTASPISERQWIVVDGRDLCQKESGWSPVVQQPQLPSRPEPVPQWQIAWENPEGGSLNNNRLQLASSTQPASVELKLTRVGAADDIASVQLRFNGLAVRVRGEQANWQRETLNVPGSQLLNLAAAQTGILSLPLELKALVSDTSARPALQAVVLAGRHSPAEQQLVCQLPIETPVRLVVQQLTCRDGQNAWSDCERQGDLVTIQPFAGRKTQFKLVLSNVDEQPRTAVVELYRLPPRSRETAAGRIADSDGQIPLTLERQSLSTLERFAVSPPMELGPRQADQDVNFSIPAAAAGASTNTPAGSSAAADITWGVLAVVRLKSEPNRDWRSWLQIAPIRASDYLSASARVQAGSQTIQFTVGLRDDNGDGIPDFVPTDLTAEKPIAIECEIASGFDLSRATLPPMKRLLTRDKAQETFVISSGKRIETEVELRVHVDDAPRAIQHFVGVDGRVGRREPPDRLWLRSIGVKDGLHYVSEFKQNYLPHESRLGVDRSAIFARPLTGPIELTLAVDSQTRNLVDAPPVPVEFRLVGDNWEHLFGQFFGDRDMTARVLEAPTESLTVECQLADWNFSYPAAASGDFQAVFQGSIRGGTSQRLGQLILDGRGPIQLGTALVKNVQAGQNSQLDFSVEDASPLGEGKVLIGPMGQPQKAQAVGEVLTPSDFGLRPNGWQVRPQPLPTADLPAGRYEVRVEISDQVGNRSILGPWPLIISPRPGAGPGDTTGAAPLKGAIRGKLYFGSTQNKPPKEVRVQLLELNNKSTTSGSGSFQLADVEAGEYTLEATMTWQGALYKGEKKIVLKKKEDWQQEFILALTKQ